MCTVKVLWQPFCLHVYSFSLFPTDRSVYHSEWVNDCRGPLVSGPIVWSHHALGSGQNERTEGRQNGESTFWKVSVVLCSCDVMLMFHSCLIYRLDSTGPVGICACGICEATRITITAKWKEAFLNALIFSNYSIIGKTQSSLTTQYIYLPY